MLNCYTQLLKIGKNRGKIGTYCFDIPFSVHESEQKPVGTCLHVMILILLNFVIFACCFESCRITLCNMDSHILLCFMCKIKYVHIKQYYLLCAAPCCYG